MLSIIEGYNYDIFISYGHKDNKYDSWVTELVDHLKKELELEKPVPLTTSRRRKLTINSRS